jgi:hypothetical protein
MTVVWIYVDTSRDVGDADHLRVSRSIFDNLVKAIASHRRSLYHFSFRRGRLTRFGFLRMFLSCVFARKRISKLSHDVYRSQ